MLSCCVFAAMVLLPSHQSKPSLVAGLAWMAGNWKSSASQYLMNGVPAGDLDKTASVLAANTNNSLAIRIASSPAKGKPYEPGELIILHASTDGKSTAAFEVVDLADEPLKLKVADNGKTITLTSSSMPVKTEQGEGQATDKIVMEQKSSDQWVYSQEITYKFGAAHVTIEQKVTFDRVR